MSDFQKITDAIRAFLIAGDRSWNNELPDLAANYAAACREANDRLRRCDEYLRRGMRSEAVHLAGCQPSLVEMAAALQFPQAPEWAQVCATNGLAIAAPLVDDLADDLEEARAVESELGALLSQHRILSLAKAPLLERIEVLSALAERDAENPCWRQEIQLLEDARVEEIRELAIAAVKAGHGEHILELLATLKDNSWHGPVPRDLRDELQRAADEANAAANIAAARKLAQELIGACEQGELDLAVQLQGRWSELARTIPPLMRDQIRETMEPALAWIDEGQRARNPEVETEPIFDASTSAAPPSLGGTLNNWRSLLSPLALKCIAAGVVMAIIGAYVVIHHFIKR